MSGNPSRIRKSRRTIRNFGPKAEGNPKTWEEYRTKARTKGFTDLIKRRFVIGSFSLLSANQDERFARAQKARRLIVDERNRFFDSFDYFLTPAAFSIPKHFDELSTAWSTHPDFLDNIRTIGNFGGYPSITVPFRRKEGRPIGRNINGRIFEDGEVLALADDVEKLTGRHDLVVKEVK